MTHPLLKSILSKQELYAAKYEDKREELQARIAAQAEELRQAESIIAQLIFRTENTFHVDIGGKLRLDIEAAEKWLKARSAA